MTQQVTKMTRKDQQVRRLQRIDGLKMIQRSDIVRLVSKKLDIRHVDVREVIDCCLNEIMDHVGRGHRVVLRGFGVFYRVKARPKMVTHWWTNQMIEWPGGWRSRFKFSKEMQARMNGYLSDNMKGNLKRKEKEDGNV